MTRTKKVVSRVKKQKGSRRVSTRRIEDQETILANRADSTKTRPLILIEKGQEKHDPLAVVRTVGVVVLVTIQSLILITLV